MEKEITVDEFKIAINKELDEFITEVKQEEMANGGEEMKLSYSDWINDFADR